MLQELEGAVNITRQDIGGLQGGHGGAFGRKDANTKGGSGKHSGIIGALADGNDVIGAQALDICSFLCSFCARCDADSNQIELLVDDVLAAVGIGGEQVKGETVAKVVEGAGQAIKQLPINGEGAVDIADQML
jgi:hypothetical protein